MKHNMESVLHLSPQARLILLTAYRARLSKAHPIIWLSPADLGRLTGIVKAPVGSPERHSQSSSVGRTVRQMTERGLLEKERWGSLYRLTSDGLKLAQALENLLVDRLIEKAQES